MGNIDTRAKTPWGYLFVKTDMPFYYPGNKVHGKIYIRAEQVVDAKFLEVRVKGKEKCSWEESSDDSTVKRKCGGNHMDCKMTAFQFNQGPLQPGDYVIPFEFDLPHDIPSSMMWKRKDTFRKPSVKVKNTIKAIMHTANGQDRYKQYLVIHEPPVNFQMNANNQKRVDLQQFLCCLFPCGSEAGSTTIMASFQKNVFYSNEVANAMITVNNSKCNHAIEEVEFQVCQKITIKDRFNSFHDTFDILENKDRKGLKAHADESTKVMQLNLGEITYHVEPTKTKKVSTGFFSAPKKITKQRSPEEIFMMSQLPPACHSRFVTNEYVLNANVKYATMDCSNERCEVQIPMTIIPLSNPATYGFQEPQGYNPAVLGNFSFTLPPIQH